jgi:pyruvate,water dikinase
MVDSQLYLLQTRPVTGVDFSWDNEIEPPETGAGDDTIWDRAWGDQAFTGAITPLFYSCRGHTQDRGLSYTLDLQGLTQASELKHFKYYRGADYYNTATEKAIATHTIWPFARDSPLCWGGTEFVEPAAREQVRSARYDWVAFAVRQLRLQLRKASSWRGNIAVVYDRWINNPHWNPGNFPAATLPKLSDEELKRFAFRYLEEEYQYFEDVWIGFVHCRDAINLLAFLVEHWYDGPNESALAELLTGVPGTSATLAENAELWAFSDRIRRSPALRALFDTHRGPAFLQALADSKEGRTFLADYREFLRKRGHRGHSDRDIYYPRRVEDPWIDYRSWQAFLSAGDTVSPIEREHAVNARREKVTAEVLARVRRGPLGPLKAQVLTQVLDFVGTWLILRDDERASLDRHSYNLKLIFSEAGRRMRERGIVDEDRDFYFLSKEELFEHLGGYGNRVLMQAKIAGRKRNFDRHYHKQVSMPPYLRDGAEPWDPALEADGGDPHRMRGIAQSKGSVTATARVVTSLEHIGSVSDGEILVCNATDPGWTSVFLVISGIITETGGVLSHAACLSREYGLPAVQLPAAMKRIPDGATVTVDGDTGEVRVHTDDEQESHQESPDVATA